MNHATNLIQYKNFTDEQKDELDFEGYRYERQGRVTEWYPVIEAPQCGDGVLRLVIEDEKFYYVEESDGITTKVLKGSEMSPINTWSVLRPARADELPKVEPTGEALVGVICEAWGKDTPLSKQTVLITEFKHRKYESCGRRYDYAVPVSVKQIEKWLEKAREFEG